MSYWEPPKWFLVACFVALPIVFNLLAWSNMKLEPWSAGFITGISVLALGVMGEAYNRRRSLRQPDDRP